MEFYFFLSLLIATPFLFLLSNSTKAYFALLLHILLIIVTSNWAIRPLFGGISIFPGFVLEVDLLSAFFILVVNFTMLTGSIYASGYLKKYRETTPKISLSVHHFTFLWLHISMLLVLMIKDGYFFLISWELMSLSSFLLVIFNADQKKIKTGINYLIQMHVGFVFLLIAFIITQKTTGNFSFYGLEDYFKRLPNFGLFFLFFIGFGIKAGFIPLHTWLPDAHPAAPSHVSAVMSGVMIKMGIYGIFRVLSFLHSEFVIIGSFILGISILTGLLGIMYAIVQSDLKKLLAYSSIENIGIIGIGLGLGIIGIGLKNPYLTYFGLIGSLLHVLNHSLFKSLLFYTAGSVYFTKNIEKLGGLIKKMPFTGSFFLFGALAICGLPPFNGFISEYLIYLGLFKSLYMSNLYVALSIILTIFSITLIGGMALFCFTKTFGIVFLGECRSTVIDEVHEASRIMLISKVLVSVLILLIVAAPFLFIKPLENIIIPTFHIQTVSVLTPAFFQNLHQISLISFLFISLVVLIVAIRYFRIKKTGHSISSTWGCGYVAPSAKMQYTSNSYADNYTKLADPILHAHREMLPISENDIFPTTRTFTENMNDFVDIRLIRHPIEWLSNQVKKISALQSGQLQHYLLYAFIFILIIGLLTLLKII